MQPNQYIYKNNEKKNIYTHIIIYIKVYKNK